MYFSWISVFLVNLVILTPKARRRSRLTTKWSDSKSPYLEIDASSDANSFEIEKLRLSAFQNGAFCRISSSKRPLKDDFESISKFSAFGENTPSANFAFGDIPQQVVQIHFFSASFLYNTIFFCIIQNTKKYCICTTMVLWNFDPKTTSKGRLRIDYSKSAPSANIYSKIFIKSNKNGWIVIHVILHAHIFFYIWGPLKNILHAYLCLHVKQ